MTETTLGDLAGFLGGSLTAPPEMVIRGVAPLESAGADELAFLANAKYERYMAATAAAAVIVADDYAGPGERLLRCGDPYFAFRQAMVKLYGFRRPHFTGVDPTAHVDPSASLGAGVRIGSHAHVGPAARIGDRTVLYPGVYVGPGAAVGADCILYPHVTIYDGTILGDRVTIHASASIGHDGFGYATHAGRHEKIPQAGRVEIGDDVEIGAGCAIDRATMGATVIGAGTKFSNLVAIGHGTRLGKGCLLVAQSGIAGSVKVGDYCVFAGQAGVVGHIAIGTGARIGAQAGVTNDVPAGQEYWGSSAAPLSEAKRTAICLSRLPQIRSAVRRLAAELTALKRRLGLEDRDEGQAEEVP